MSYQTTIGSLTVRLIETLEREAQHLRRTTDCLATLSRLVLKRDEAGLHALLEQVHQESANRERDETARHELVAAIAEAAGCQPATITLTSLAGLVEPGQQQMLRDKKAELQRLIDGLRRQHYSTTMLLGEMIRINRSLIAGITGGTNSVTYGRGGQARWGGAENILNLRY